MNFENLPIVGCDPNGGPYSSLAITTNHMAPTLRRGDSVALDTSVTQYDGPGLYVLLMGGQPCVYRVDWHDRGLLIMCDDPGYSQHKVTPEDFTDLVLGKVRVAFKVIDDEWAAQRRAG